jgi:VWFA-related protein
MWVLTVLTLAATAPAQSQTEPPPSQQTPSFRAQSTLVLVPTLVRDHAGKPVFTLTANDFTVTDNGVEQKVSLEDDTDSQPLALVVAVETGGGGARQLENYGNLPTLVESLVGNVQHQVAVIDFDSESRLDQDFTSDWVPVAGALQSLRPGNDGAAILDAVSYSVDLLRQQPPQYRRAILLLSETNDHGSHIGVAETVRAVSDTNTIIYSLAFSSTKSNLKKNGSRILRDDRPGPPHGCMGKDPDDPDQNRLLQAWNCLGLLAPPIRAAQLAVMAGVDGLRRNAPETIAQLTGGEYYKFNNPRSLEGALVSISNHVPNRYVLSFRPQDPQPGPHALEVRLKDYSKLDITARKTYWADNGATAARQPPPKP